MRKIAILLFALWVGAITAGSAVAAGHRIALVVGISDYQSLPKLRNPVNDARLIAESLQAVGFDVRLLIEPDRRDFYKGIQSFVDVLSQSGDTTAVMYFAGHGIQFDGMNYLIPQDAKIVNEGDIELTSVSLSQVIEKVGGAATRSLFILDAARDNPFDARSNTRSIASRGLAAADPSRSNVAIFYAAEPGALALDGEDNNGPFARAVAKYIREPGLELITLQKRVRIDVLTVTKGFQNPYFSSSLFDDFYFQPAAAVVEQPAVPDAQTRAAQVVYEAEAGDLVPTYEDGSYALLVGVSKYDKKYKAWRDLPDVAVEIDKLGQVLHNVHGFEVETVMDPTGAQLEEALESFINRNGRKTNARLFFYLSGHGITVENKLTKRKTGWFVPYDAPSYKDSATLFVNTALNLTRVTEWLELIEAKHVLWAFDSCFSGQVLRMQERKAEDGMRPWERDMHMKPVRRILTAGSESEEVPARSRFAEAMTKVLKGEIKIGDKDGLVTGEELGYFLKRDLVDYSLDSGVPQHPQSDTIIIPDSESGDILFRIEPDLVSKLQ
jgi:uncharacterized caspase-like protein